jgi:dephospho-CoA kinase
MLRELDAQVVDADELARRVVEPGAPALAEIVARFGQEVLDPSGALDRKKLGAIVFADAEARQALERITHPRIAAAASRELARLAAEGHDAVIYEAALIVEKKLYTWMDGLVVVSLPPEVQLARLMERDGIDREAAASRIAAQLPLADKIAVADHVIDNSGTQDQTRAQVRALWQRINAS